MHAPTKVQMIIHYKTSGNTSEYSESQPGSLYVQGSSVFKFLLLSGEVNIKLCSKRDGIAFMRVVLVQLQRQMPGSKFPILETHLSNSSFERS
jgi:hypothetical protein